MSGFVWRVDVGGYRWLKIPPSEMDDFDDGFSLRLEPATHGFRMYAPLDQPGLFQQFSDLQITPDAVLTFANRWGHLGAYHWEPDEPPEPSDELTPPELQRWERDVLFSLSLPEPFDLWAREVPLMRRCVGIWQDMQDDSKRTDERKDHLCALINEQLRANRVSLELVNASRRPSGFRLGFIPSDLLGAMWLQFAEAVAANKSFHRCGTCGTWFEVSSEQYRKSRKYCSGPCRSRAYRDRKVQAIRMAEEGMTLENIAETLKTRSSVVTGWLQSDRE